MSHFVVVVVLPTFTTKALEVALDPFGLGFAEDNRKLVDVHHSMLAKYKKYQAQTTPLSSQMPFNEFAENFLNLERIHGRFCKYVYEEHKWDGWKLGGRWTGNYLAKADAIGNNMSVNNTLGFDVIRKGDIDVEKMQRQALEHARKSSEAYGKNKELFLKDVAKSSITTSAILKDGVWHQCLESNPDGWVAVKSDWNDEWLKVFESIDDDHYICVVDCHI